MFAVQTKVCSEEIVCSQYKTKVCSKEIVCFQYRIKVCSKEIVSSQYRIKVCSKEIVCSQYKLKSVVKGLCVLSTKLKSVVKRLCVLSTELKCRPPAGWPAGWLGGRLADITILSLFVASRIVENMSADLFLCSDVPENSIFIKNNIFCVCFSYYLGQNICSRGVNAIFITRGRYF